MSWMFWVAFGVYLATIMVLAIDASATADSNRMGENDMPSLAEQARCPLTEDAFLGCPVIFVLLATLGWFIALPFAFIFFLVKLLFGPYGGNDEQELLPESAGHEGQAPAGDADDQELYRR